MIAIGTAFILLNQGGQVFASGIDGGFVTPQWLNNHLHDANLRVVAVSFEPEDFEQEHIPGSVFVDWRSDLADTGEFRYYKIVSRNGFETIMERIGVAENTTIIFYDNWNNRLAIRALWVSDFYGHHNTAILEGGIDAWKAAGFETNAETSWYTPTRYRVDTKRQEINTGLEYVRSHIHDNEVLIVDGRPHTMYTGMIRGTAVHTGEKIEGRGHIPGSVNLPWKKNIDHENRFLDRHTLMKLYTSRGITGEKTTVFYCNEGVHAAYDWFVADRILGFKNVSVYDGSMAEWSDDPGLPLEIGNE
jgi:thiosulfate/3-mercaptopyruvate sulfurtransferase